MRTLKWFSMEWIDYWNTIIVYFDSRDANKNWRFTTEQKAFEWLETNGYIKRI